MPKTDDRDEFLRATMGAMDLVYNIARRFVDGPEDAEDLVQETYLAAYRAWRDHRRPRRVEPWIATICLNLGRSRYRGDVRRPKEVSIEAPDLQASETFDPEQAALASLDRRALYEGMRRLTEEHRLALTLVDLVGLSTKEAASVMGTPKGTVLSRLHRGRRALAALLWNDVKESDER